MPRIRRWLRSWSLPSRSTITGRTVAGWLSRGTFLLVALALLALSVSADMVAIAVLAGVLLSQFLYVILPVERIRAGARRLFTGEAGEEAYEEAVDRVDDTGSWFR